MRDIHTDDLPTDLLSRLQIHETADPGDTLDEILAVTVDEEFRLVSPGGAPNFGHYAGDSVIIHSSGVFACSAGSMSRNYQPGGTWQDWMSHYTTEDAARAAPSAT